MSGIEQMYERQISDFVNDLRWMLEDWVETFVVDRDGGMFLSQIDLDRISALVSRLRMGREILPIKYMELTKSFANHLIKSSRPKDIQVFGTGVLHAYLYSCDIDIIKQHVAKLEDWGKGHGQEG